MLLGFVCLMLSDEILATSISIHEFTWQIEEWNAQTHYLETFFQSHLKMQQESQQEILSEISVRYKHTNNQARRRSVWVCER